MSFSILVNNNETFPVIYLKDETLKTQVEIYSFGALLNKFIVDGKQNIIEGFLSCDDAKANITNGFKSSKLSPFVCRIVKGEYSFQQKKYKTGKFFTGEEALHGLLYDAEFSVKDYDENDAFASVELEYKYEKTDEGFPFKCTCLIKYLLEKNNQLSIITTIKNNSENEMPLNDGWHPYFSFNKKINQLTFQINSNKMVEFNEHLVPTGNIISYNKFQQPELINETVLDNCFELKNTTNAACILKDEEDNLQLEILPDASYPYLQVYTPESRSSIAIENLSSAPDSFNNKIGLIVLRPNESKIFTTKYQATFF